MRSLKVRSVDRFNALCVVVRTWPNRLDMSAALVGKLKLHAVSHRGERGESLDLLESATRAALQAAATEVGDEHFLVERLDIGLRVVVRGAENPSEAVRTHLLQLLRSKLAEARAHTDPHWVREGFAWFASEAVALAFHLEGLVSGKSKRWPYTSLARLGADLDASIARAQTSGSFWAEVLASLAQYPTWPTVANALAPHAEELLRRVEQGSSGSLDGLPDAIWAEIRARSAHVRALLAGDPSPELELLLAAAALFALWPPARTLGVSRAMLREKLGGRTQTERLLSRAGGLALWAKLYQELGLDAAFRRTAEQAPARWAVARALEDASVPASDPLFALFAGESPGPLLMESRLRNVDPEPLIGLALRAVARELEGADVRLSTLGDGAVALSKAGIIVDVQYEQQGDAALQGFVKRFRARTSMSPGAVEARERISDADLDAVTELDAAALPLTWRAAALIVASVIRHRLRSAGVTSKALRLWPATIVDRKRIELRRADAHRVLDGAWLSEPLSVGAGTFELVAI